MPTNDLASESSRAGREFRFGRPSPSDGPALWELADQAGLDLNSPYAYVMWCDYFADTSLVVRDGDQVCGSVIGFRPPQQPDTLFVWQIAVATSARRTGLAGRMLDHLVDRLGVTHVEATVTPDNAASAALFRALGARHHASVVEELAYPATLFPGGHDAEVRFTIGPIDRGADLGDPHTQPSRGDTK